MMAFAAAVLGIWNGNDKRMHSQKTKMTHLSTCPFEVPQLSLVCSHVGSGKGARSVFAAAVMGSGGGMVMMSAQHS